MYRKFSRDTEENIHSELSEIYWDLAMRNCGDNAVLVFLNSLTALNIKQAWTPSTFIKTQSQATF